MAGVASGVSPGILLPLLRELLSINAASAVCVLALMVALREHILFWSLESSAFDGQGWMEEAAVDE